MNKNNIADTLYRVFKNPYLVPSKSDFINITVNSYLQLPTTIQSEQIAIDLELASSNPDSTCNDSGIKVLVNQGVR